MSWTYSGDPGDSDKDWVRFRIGDTDTNDQQLSNEEILALLEEEGSTWAAAAAAARALAAKFARYVDKSVGDLRLSYSQRQQNYLSLATQLETRQSLRTAMPKVGGQSISRKESVDDDTDRVQPAFKRGQFDHEGGDDPSDGV